MSRLIDYFRSVLVISVGDVVRKRIRPALMKLAKEGIVDRVVYSDILPEAPFALNEGEVFPRGEHYFRLGDANCIPWQSLSGIDFFSEPVLGVVASPTPLHGHYARRLSLLCPRVTVEKPFCMDPIEARKIFPMGNQIFPICHQVFKASMLHFLKECSVGRF